MKEGIRDQKRVLTGLILGALLVVTYFFCSRILPQSTFFSQTTEFGTSADSFVELGGDTVVEQTIVMPFERVSAIAPVLVSDKNKNEANITVEFFKEDGELLLTRTFSKAYITHVYEKIETDGFIDVKENGTYKIRIYSDSPENIGVYVAMANKTLPNTLLSVNGVLTDATLDLTMDGGYTGQKDKTPFLVFYAVFAAILLICVVALVGGSMPFYYDRTELLDKVVVGILMLFCAICISETNDIQVIVRGSAHLIDAITKGHFRDFYTYTCSQEVLAGNFGEWAYNYNILQYFFVAVCILPFKSIIPLNAAFYLYYIQLVVTALMLYSGYLLKSVTKTFGLDASFQRSAPFLFLTSGLGIFAAVGFGQIDIVFIVIFLWALRFYAEKKYYRFSLLMSLAIAYKTFPILIFIPMILLTNKKIREIVINGAIGVSTMLITGLIFNGTEGYKVMQKLADNEQHFIDKLSLSRIENGGMHGIALFILGFVLICAYAYMKDVSQDEPKEVYAYVGLLGFMVYVDIFCFLIWHIPWLMPMSLFTAMLLPFFPKIGRLLVMEVLMELMALVVAEIWNLPNIGMLDYGVQATIWESVPYRGPNVGDLTARLSPVVSDLAFACMTGVLLYMTFYFVRELPQVLASHKKNTPAAAIHRGWAWGRIGIVVLYSVFCLWCFYYIG